jgi:predicted nucleotidyltransferase
MRKSSILDALFPKARQQILAVFFMSPGREWYLSALARHLRVRPSSLQRELASLTKAGILRWRKDGNRTYYQAETASPVFEGLHGLLLRTAGLREVLIEGIEPFKDRIQVAFVYGSVARDEERAASDIDLMVIGRVGLSELVPALKDAEDQLGRSVNPSIYPTDEFARKLAEGHHFLKAVMKGKKLFILGDRHDLDAALESQPSAKARDKQARAR